MNEAHTSDALVLFGATGDLARRKIFPALHDMLRHGRTLPPIVCVAHTEGWDLERLRAHARAGIEEFG
ncbi:MAG: glucose-6-phosphate dehydrogenase, partial [Pseudomonadota bacterium]